MEKWEKDLEMRNARLESFNDTCMMCRNEKSLEGSVRNSVNRQEIILDSDPVCGVAHADRHGRVSVTSHKTLEAAAAYKQKKTAVLNFASPFTPGGCGQIAGLTQEECLCRESTLWSCISAADCINLFYVPHRIFQGADDWIGNRDMIYTPDVTVFKTCDSVPVLMKEDGWFDVDVITMAAPLSQRAGKKKLSDNEMIDIFKQRFVRIIQTASVKNVEVLILGAFGCGAFGNDPAVVATGAARAIEETKCLETFEHIEFACYDTRRKKNYRMFRLVLDRYLNASV